MAAIYEAITELNLVYCVPASFEESGQRVRICDTIFSQKMANCLDISLIVCKLLGSCGSTSYHYHYKGTCIRWWMVE